MALTFDSDGRLLDGEHELARAEPASSPAFALIVAGGTGHEVVRRRRSGWRFLLVAPDGGRVAYDFRPSLVRRGGTIAGEGHVLVLHPHQRRGSSWRISSPDRAPIEVRRSPGRHEDVAADGGRRVRLGGGLAPVLSLDSDDEMALAGRPPELLAFACWLIVQWETLPAAPAAGG